MPTRLRRRSSLAVFLIPAVLTAVSLYFGWQNTRGAYSAEAREALYAERLEKTAQLDAVVAEREALEAKVRLLRTDQLAADLLDERARVKLGLARPDEIVIFHRSAQPATALTTAGLR